LSSRLFQSESSGLAYGGFGCLLFFFFLKYYAAESPLPVATIATAVATSVAGKGSGGWACVVIFEA